MVSMFRLAAETMNQRIVRELVNIFDDFCYTANKGMVYLWLNIANLEIKVYGFN